ncbi:MAG: BON domain-containing protein [Actinobacteria bacterium]|nr:BON domain-containing protein [Actinomycetota bacterium]
MNTSEIPGRIGGRLSDVRDTLAGAMAAESTTECRELGRTRRALESLTDRIDALDAADEARYEKLKDRIDGGGSWFGRMFWMLVGAGVGTGVAYLMDPQMGNRRRAEMKQQLGSQARDLKDTATQQASYAAGVAQGKVIETAKGAVNGSDEDVDPHTLRQRVQSQVIGTTEGALDVVVAVHDGGVVALKGRVRDAQTEEKLIDLTRKVPGVKDVRDELQVG